MFQLLPRGVSLMFTSSKSQFCSTLTYPSSLSKVTKQLSSAISMIWIIDMKMRLKVKDAGIVKVATIWNTWSGCRFRDFRQTLKLMRIFFPCSQASLLFSRFVCLQCFSLLLPPPPSAALNADPYPSRSLFPHSQCSLVFIFSWPHYKVTQDQRNAQREMEISINNSSRGNGRRVAKPERCVQPRKMK